MKTITDQLANYAGYHRDRRNILTHFIGIPMIVLAIAILLSRPVFGLPGLALTVSPVWLLAIASTLFYLALDLRFGMVMGVLMAITVWVAAIIASGSTASWLGWGIGLFVVGWAFQFVGHIFEGRKPAFVDDLVGLLIGPLFVVAELAFMLGLCRSLNQDIEARVGPVHNRRQTTAPQ
ncbi:Mpo1-like protein [uncultured Marinobacter sp.]|uniref:Mpo1 family 2-hydroxy fatty acid dioxygenase n=1 Tax=uncultured Marinobacter sp. TaxID=187379 RepID=UPI0030DC7558